MNDFFPFATGAANFVSSGARLGIVFGKKSFNSKLFIYLHAMKISDKYMTVSAATSPQAAGAWVCETMPTNDFTLARTLVTPKKTVGRLAGTPATLNERSFALAGTSATLNERSFALSETSATLNEHSFALAELPQPQKSK